jgi:RNase P/RNase MRP subunit p29
MKHKVWIIGVAVAMVALVIGGTVWAAEAIRPGWLRGQVVAVGDMSLTIQTQDGETEVLVTEETVFRVPGVAEATLNDILVGTHLLIQAMADEQGVLTAQAIVVRAAPGLQNNFVRGRVTAVDDGRVSVETAGGTAAMLLITGDTHLWVPGEPPTTTVELMIGDPVLAIGAAAPSETGEKALSVRLVVVVSDEDLPRILIQGRAVAITEQTIVVQTGRRERAITVTRHSRIWSAKGRLDSLHDLHQGERIIALGQPTELGQWIAGLVLLPGAEPLTRNGLRGQVIDMDLDAGTLIVETEQRGQITVMTGDETRYRIPGIEEPGFADLQVGDQIVAVGRFEQDDPTTFLARGIGVVGPAAGGTAANR